MEHPDAAVELPRFELRALRLTDDGWGAGWELRPSPSRRHWMGQRPNAYHCLPMVMANAWGWQVLCPTDVIVSWNGLDGPESLSVEVAEPWRPAIKSQFGAGIVTFSPPWLFRTPPGWDLYCKGPGNRWKKNCAPLEGIIETWWLNYTFTLNWKIIEPGVVFFAKGESLAQLLPVPHATFDDSTAFEAPINDVEPAAGEELLRWLDERRKRAAAPPADRIHKLYRKAEDVEGHLAKVSVPEVERLGKESGGSEAPSEPMS